MRRVLGRSVAGLALVSVLACAPAPPPPITPPPLTADVEAWPDMTWAGTIIEPRPAGMRDESVTALTGSDDTIVAVGLASGEGRDIGQAWWSGLDGAMTRATGPFDGVGLEDVATGPGGFVALGTRLGEPSRGEVTRLALFHSIDGRTWRAVLDGARAPDGLATGIAGGPDGYVAVGYTDPEPGLIVLTSPDGLAWTRVDATVDGVVGSIGRPEFAGDGWIAPGGPPVSPDPLSVVRSSDGVTWTSTPVEVPDTNGRAVNRVLAGPGGYLAGGIASDGCGPGASCPGEAITWWSADWATWGRQVDIDPAVPVSAWGVHPDRGFVAISGVQTRSSPDGWRWTSIGDGALDEIGVDDVVVVGDRIVGGGTSYRPDGTTRASFLVGAPD